MNSLVCPACGASTPFEGESRPKNCPSCGALYPTPPEAPAAEATLTPPTFEVAAYQPTPGSSGSALGSMLAVGLVAAVLLGVLASFIGQFIYFILIFPVLIGLGVGGAMVWAARQTKMHSPLAAGLLGLWCGVIAMATVHYSDYLRATSELPAGFNISFPQFMELAATLGVTIGKGGGINLGYTGTVIYWLVEVGVVAGIVFAMCRRQAAKPFCVECNQWKQPHTFGPFVHAPTAAKQLVESGAAANMGPARDVIGGEFLLLQVAVCPECHTANAVDVSLEHLTPWKDGVQKKVLCHTTYPGEAFNVIQACSQPRQALAEAAPPAV